MKNASLLEIQGLRVRVEDKEILHGVDLTVGKDETHVLMVTIRQNVINSIGLMHC